MAANQQTVNIWAQMNYTPPRGPCSQKTSLVSTCACFRFMIHPLKASTSFECDGCGHHASFHKMDNEIDEETIKRWRMSEDKEGAQLRLIAGVLKTGAGLRDNNQGKRKRIESRPAIEISDGNTSESSTVKEKATKRKRTNGR